MRATVDFSVIVPVFDEVASLLPFWTTLEPVLGALPGETEVVFVDDGSTDGSTEVIRGLVHRDARVRLVRLAANAGLSAAFHAGFAAARGRILMTLDSDLQNDPADLPRLLAHLDRWDAVVGARDARHDPWLKRASSRLANAVRRRVTGDEFRDSACSLRIMRRECAAAIPPLDGMHRFLPLLLQLAGYRVVEVPVRHHPRPFGRSKYGVRNRLARASLDLLAVRWMMGRRFRFEIAEVAEEGERRAPTGAPPATRPAG
ncbi:MAG TPA: glycosyltransferase [Candidatus Rokubacteria bacterium]|nr:MAG: hypothetical protein A2050_01025 [Candidatus Rokubacteria bacterium GWA2_73_35]OGK87536.1 MAG: hypothetical protein A2X52_20320 [Candidatus Rokubacteria bacterium GWC2_70_16]HBH03620.1 glycosyltransferase [Candidatus Rokubacteria bacterium]